MGAGAPSTSPDSPSNGGTGGSANQSVVLGTLAARSKLARLRAPCGDRGGDAAAVNHHPASPRPWTLNSFQIAWREGTDTIFAKETPAERHLSKLPQRGNEARRRLGLKPRSPSHRQPHRTPPVSGSPSIISSGPRSPLLASPKLSATQRLTIAGTLDEASPAKMSANDSANYAFSMGTPPCVAGWWGG